MESYRKLEEVRRYSNKELKVSRDLIEAVIETNFENVAIVKIVEFVDFSYYHLCMYIRNIGEHIYLFIHD